MALIHQATLTPSKLELLAQWLPSRRWYSEGGGLARVGSYRFDDPDGEVGIEVMLIEQGGKVFQAPLSYRAQPLEGGSEFLVGTMEHSVLGPRWVYDGAGDPVVLCALINATAHGAPQAILEVEIEGKMITRPNDVNVQANGSATGVPQPVRVLSISDSDEKSTIETHDYRVDIARVVGASTDAPFVLQGTWAGQSSAPLVGVTPLGA